MMPNQAPEAGFADPVQDSQRAFRALLDAMARPGRVTDMPARPGHPAGLAPALAAALLTLCDLDSPVWIGPGFDGGDVANWLRFHTGAPILAAPTQASIALLLAEQLPAPDSFALGSDLAPEGGATLLIQTTSLAGQAAMTWQGPGIKDTARLPLCGVDIGFWQQRAALAAAFPRGLDCYLGCGAALIGLPRSTRIRIGEA